MSEPLTLPSPQGGEGGKVVEVVAAVIEREGRILIARRPAALHLGGLWEFPGGKRQPGETPEAALVREIREELDAAVTVGELLDDVEWTYPEKTVRLLFFRCALAGEPRRRRPGDRLGGARGSGPLRVPARRRRPRRAAQAPLTASVSRPRRALSRRIPA